MLYKTLNQHNYYDLQMSTVFLEKVSRNNIIEVPSNYSQANVQLLIKNCYNAWVVKVKLLCVKHSSINYEQKYGQS